MQLDPARSDNGALADAFALQLEQLAVEHGLRPLVLVRAQPAREQFAYIDDGDGPGLVSELLRLARLGAFAERQAILFPHTKIRTVVRNAPGPR